MKDVSMSLKIGSMACKYHRLDITGRLLVTASSWIECPSALSKKQAPKNSIKMEKNEFFVDVLQKWIPRENGLRYEVLYPKRNVVPSTMYSVIYREPCRIQVSSTRRVSRIRMARRQASIHVIGDLIQCCDYRHLRRNGRIRDARYLRSIGMHVWR